MQQKGRFCRFSIFRTIRQFSDPQKDPNIYLCGHSESPPPELCPHLIIKTWATPAHTIPHHVRSDHSLFKDDIKTLSLLPFHLSPRVLYAKTEASILDYAKNAQQSKHCKAEVNPRISGALRPIFHRVLGCLAQRLDLDLREHSKKKTFQSLQIFLESDRLTGKLTKGGSLERLYLFFDTETRMFGRSEARMNRKCPNHWKSR